jgi:RNA processing factor Prp31
LYAKLAKFIVNKSDLTEKDIPALADITGDEDKAKEIVEAAKASMGKEIWYNFCLIVLVNCFIFSFVFRPGSVTS